MIKWKDATSYSRNTKERIPSILECTIKGLRIVVHRIRHCEGWFLSCYNLQIDDKKLMSTELEQAKKEGLRILIDEISALSDIKDILKENL